MFIFRSGCKRSMNHLKEGSEHEAKHQCRYSAQYDNRIYTCKVSVPRHAALNEDASDYVSEIFSRPATREGRR